MKINDEGWRWTRRWSCDKSWRVKTDVEKKKKEKGQSNERQDNTQGWMNGEEWKVGGWMGGWVSKL